MQVLGALQNFKLAHPLLDHSDGAEKPKKMNS
jgi:hypothetical protein